jgi:hypothetical protein
MVVVPQAPAQLPDALHQRLFGHHNVRPDGLDKFFLRHEPPGVSSQVREDLEGFRSKVDVLLARAQGSARQVEYEAVEPEHLVRDRIHADSQMGAYHAIWKL